MGSERSVTTGCCPLPIADERSPHKAMGCCPMIERKTHAAAHIGMGSPLPLTNNPLRQGYIVAEAAVRAVIAGRKPMQMICSKAGLGKTYMVNREIRRAGIIRDAAFISPRNDAAFAEALYLARDVPVLVVDDCDTLARSERIANIFKQAFGPTRVVNYESKKTLAVDRFPLLTDMFMMMPSQFKVRARLIWLSNLNFTDDGALSDKMTPHFKAMASRGLDPIWIDSDDDVDHFNFVLWMVVERHMLRSQHFRREVTVSTVNWFIERRNYLKELSPRTMVRIADTFKQYPDECERDLMLSLMVVKEPLRDIPGIPPLRIVGHEWA
jgi:hypothetical protein